jgi:2-succinyl-6-hydroxy-2,4-cyclohexadiene-1-carboxylate synthase
MGSSADWSETMETLGERYRCVAVDLPGHGVSTDLAYPDSYTMEGAARGVLDVLDGLGVRTSVLAGYSMGGRLALYLALRFPERCRALFLESVSPGLGDEGARARRRAADEERARRLETGEFEGFLLDWYAQPLFASLARDEALVGRTIERRRRNDPLELARSLRGMGTGSMPPLWGELRGLKIPALAVAGELDEKFVGISQRMSAVSPRVKTIVVPAAGHNVRVESPDRYLALLGRILGDP